ncbi:MAG TPA: CpaF family protein, partial [Allosphingosinicella sp.]|nr:CpaF family protein [Allosphingosinicella sp.]
MKGGGAAPLPLDGGDQFPPLDALDGDDFGMEAPSGPGGDAMSRLQDRMALSGDQGSSKVEGF